MQVFFITTLIKFLGNKFFIWSMPLVIIYLNIIKDRDILASNVYLALIAGFIINFIWRQINSLIQSDIK